MSPIKAATRTIALVLAAVWLCACVTVFPKEKAAQLYRFDGATARAEGQAPAPGTASFSVLRTGGSFTRAASGDKILSVNGDKAAFVADARWLAPATTLFDEAMARAFDANTGPARLVTRGQNGKTDFSMRIDVRRFEVVYDHGNAAPLVVVSLRATLTRPDRTLAGDQMFESRIRAGDNRVSAIVGAYDLAVSEVLTKLVDWTNKATPA